MVRMDGAAAMCGTQRQGMAAGATSAAAWHDSGVGHAEAGVAMLGVVEAQGRAGG